MAKRARISAAALFPVLDRITSIMASASSPAFAPMASASEATAMLAASMMLFTSFIAWAWPGCSPSLQIFFAMSVSHGIAVATTSSLPDSMMDKVPARAAAGPPLTGASMVAMFEAASRFVFDETTVGPSVDISMYVRMFLPAATSVLSEQHALAHVAIRQTGHDDCGRIRHRARIGMRDRASFDERPDRFRIRIEHM